MKKLALGLMCISLLLTLVIPTIAKAKPTKPTYLTNEDKLYQFQRPGRAWGEKKLGNLMIIASSGVTTQLYTLVPEYT